MKLYHFPKTRSSRVLWAAKELGVDLDLVTVNLLAGEQRQPAYAAVNPHGKIPVLEDEATGLTLIESGAIVTWLQENAGSGDELIPPRGTVARARYWEWMFYVNATLDELTLLTYLHAKLFPPEMRKPELVEANTARWKQQAAPFIAGRLGQADWACGDAFTLADVFLGYDLVLAADLGFLEGHDSLQRYVGRVTEREAFRVAMS